MSQCRLEKSIEEQENHVYYRLLKEFSRLVQYYKTREVFTFIATCLTLSETKESWT